jgi:hypothetical protein
MEIERTDRLNNLAALSRAVEAMPNHQPLAPIGRATTTLEMMAAQRVAVPRDIPSFLQRVKVLASVAGDNYFYSFPVKSKNKDTGEWEQSAIEGPSIKLANDLVREYGNCGVETMVVDVGDSWIIYARFVDLERGFTMVRPFQQRKSQKGLGTKDEARALDIALQVGVSKAIRNVIVNSLETFAEVMFEEAKNSITEKIAKQPDRYRAVLKDKLAGLGVDLKRVETTIGRVIADWTVSDMARVIAHGKAVQDGMATADEIWPRATDFKAPPELRIDTGTGTPPAPEGKPDPTPPAATETKPAPTAPFDPAPLAEMAAKERARGKGKAKEAEPTPPAATAPAESERLSESCLQALSEVPKMHDAEQLDVLLEMAADLLPAGEFTILEKAVLERKGVLSDTSAPK